MATSKELLCVPCWILTIFPPSPHTEEFISAFVYGVDICSLDCIEFCGIPAADIVARAVCVLEDFPVSDCVDLCYISFSPNNHTSFSSHSYFFFLSIFRRTRKTETAERGFCFTEGDRGTLV